MVAGTFTANLNENAVCLAGQLRALPSIASTIQEYLVAALKADLFLYGPATSMDVLSSSLDHFPTLVQVRLKQENLTHALIESSAKYGDGHAWQRSAAIPGNWLTGIDGQGPEMLRFGSGLYQLYGQLQCAEMVEDWEKQGRADHQYTYVVYSRPDFEWLGPHLPLDYLTGDSIWMPDGEENGGINDRHWVIPRPYMSTLLRSWDKVADGTAPQWFAITKLPWLSTEIWFSLVLMYYKLFDRIRHLPLTAFVLCASPHNRKPVDMSATGLDDTLRTSEFGIRCRQGGPKYIDEYRSAAAIVKCKGTADWSVENLWRCWCSQKVNASMAEYSNYRLCELLGIWLGHVQFIM